MKSVLTKKDKEIISHILDFIDSEDGLVEDIAGYIERESGGELDESDPRKFDRWLRKVTR
jgi:hypothetical protein